MKAILSTVLVTIPLAGCVTKAECDQQRAAFIAAQNAPTPMRSMTVRDLTTEDRDDIEIACRMRTEIGDIRAKQDCRKALEAEAIAGRQVKDYPWAGPPIPQQPNEACSLPWNQ